MHWELWDIESGNLVGSRESETEAYELVRDLVVRGWPIGSMSLLLDDPALADEDLPEGISGEELARRAGLTGSDQSRRTA